MAQGLLPSGSVSQKEHYCNTSAAEPTALVSWVRSRLGSVFLFFCFTKLAALQLQGPLLSKHSGESLQFIQCAGGFPQCSMFKYGVWVLGEMKEEMAGLV
jgi:hypothetical protein